MGRILSPTGAKCPRIKANQEPCKLLAGFGTDHLGWGSCKYHGGTSPAMKAKAAKDQVADRLRMPAYGTPVDIEPGDALLGEVRRSAGIVAWLETVIAEFSQIDIVDLRANAKDILQTLGDQGREVAVWVGMYRDERKMLRAAASEALRNNIAERQVRVAEEQGRLVAHVLQAVFNDPELGLTQKQRLSSRQVSQKHLALIGRGVA